jgi:DNA-directed RNA polymerase subunit alpha
VPLSATMEPIDIRARFAASPKLEKGEIENVLRAATGPQAAEFERTINDLTAQAAGDANAAVRAGIGQFYLGRPQQAVALLEGSSDGLGLFYLGQALATLDRHQDAVNAFERAEKAGYDRIDCTLRRAGELRALGQLEEAEKVVRSTGSQGGAGRAEYSYQMGCILADRGDTFGAIEYFERAVDMDPHHSRGLFSLAVQNSIHGNDNEAIRLYERALSRPPFYLGALLNLGLLYEDKENYPAAEYCFRQVLRFDPTNERALLYLKDIEATSDMYYDEETLKNQARLEHLLTRPVTDFELSVRSRNCLASMNIQTLGNLTEVSEQELLSGKNFGETSLVEIRDLMQSHGLTIGQNLHEKISREPMFNPQELSPQEQALIQQPVTELNLSVRSRKCMTRLGITTIGELISRTPDELLSAKNFGVTSLNEIRQKLAEFELRLRND